MTTNPRRRAKGGGSVRQRTKGSFELRYYGPPDISGARQRIYETFRGSRREAERELRERVGDVETGTYIEKSAETLSEFLWRWLETYVVTNTRPRTQQGYKTNIRRISNYIGAIPVQNLRPQHVQKMYATLTEKGLSAQTILHTHRVLRAYPIS